MKGHQITFTDGSQGYCTASVPKNMSEPSMHEISAAMAVRDLMSATSSLSEMAAGKSTARLVMIEANDIELAYTRLGRMLSHIRK